MSQPSMKEAIRKAGRAEFHEHGYHGTGIAAITTRAAAHKGSFYNHYASKEDLAVEVISDYSHDQHMDMLQDTSTEPLKRIELHFAAIVEGLREFDFRLGCLLGNFSTEVSSDTPLIQKTVQANLDAWISLLTTALEQAALEHSAANYDAATTAGMLIDAYEGAALRGRATSSEQPMNAFLTAALPQTLDAFRSHYTR